MDPDDGNHEPNRKGCRREAGSEGSGTQTPGPRYTKRIGGIHSWVRGHKDPKPDSHPEGMGVDATGIWEERRCVIPGEICPSALCATFVVRREDGWTEVSRGHSSFGAGRSEGPNMEER
jgi:hypothetical protein